jgi:two-component system OmpR family response regulator
LVVDDDPYTRFGLRSLFSRQGWDVALAGTVTEAVAALDPAPQCVILDLDLPDGDGAAVLREVRARRLPTVVAVCSGIADPARLGPVQGLHPELMLCKPMEPAVALRLCALGGSARAN